MGSITSSLGSNDDNLKLYRDYFNEKIEKNKVVIFSQTTCGYCQLAKEIFDQNNIKYQIVELNVDENCPKNDCKLLRQVLVKQTGLRTVPQIFINGKLIGGYTELNNLAEKGDLNKIAK